MMENKSMCESTNNQKNYGSTGNYVGINSNEVLIKHIIEETDTLQGISLKYGCTMEKIRRINRLFSSDSLFLRYYLLIPIQKLSPYYSEILTSHSILNGGSNIVKNDLDKFSLNENQKFQFHLNPFNSITTPTSFTNNNIQVQSSTINNNEINDPNRNFQNTSPVKDTEEDDKNLAHQFLNKIDLNIAESKKYFAKYQQNKNGSCLNQNNCNNSIKYRQNQAIESANDIHLSDFQKRKLPSGISCHTAHIHYLSRDKRVQSSLQRLEKQQNEYFEL